MGKIKRIILLSMFVFPFIFPCLLYGEQVVQIRGSGVIVLFEEPLKKAAMEVIDIYPGLITELENTLRWKLHYEPAVLLIKDRETFWKIVRNDLIVACAIPEKKSIVIDYSRMNISPFTLGTTLKHELCHLLLHQYVPEGKLPKWLDEGIAQWVSNGMAEIIMDRSDSVLSRVSLTGNYIPIGDLTERFPGSREALLLAYDESKSLVEYIVGEYGIGAILDILRNLRNGDTIDTAVPASISIPLDELEEKWHASLNKKIIWVTWLSDNLYGILFFLMAMVTIFAFFKLLKRKKIAYMEEDDD